MSDSDDDEVRVRRYKCIILGDGACGKTSIIHRFTDDAFAQSYKQTIGVDFAMKKLLLPQKVEVALQIWDIGGQQLGSRMLSNYISGSDAIIFVFDLTNYQSFRNVEDWLSLAQKSMKKPARFVLCGNKLDLPHIREVKKDKYIAFATDHNMSSCEVSAKTGFGVIQMFTTVAAELAGVAMTRTEIEAGGKVVKAEIVNHPVADSESFAQASSSSANAGRDTRGAAANNGSGTVPKEAGSTAKKKGTCLIS